MKISDASEVMTKSSPYSVAETMARFNEVVVAKDMKVFAIINHSDAAQEVGLELPETKVIIFGKPEAGTPVMEAAPLIALELPLKVLIWEDRTPHQGELYGTASLGRALWPQRQPGPCARGDRAADRRRHLLRHLRY